MCVFDNFLGVYSQYIKKLTREKLIELCREFFNTPQILRDCNNIPILEVEDDSDDEDE